MRHASGEVLERPAVDHPLAAADSALIGQREFEWH
jgi:hypothetical protein